MNNFLSKLCIPLAITHTNSGKEIQKFFFSNKVTLFYYHFSSLFYAILAQEVTIKPLLFLYLLY